MEKKKFFRTLIGMMLAFAITFAAVPQTASAAFSSSQVNTSAKAGKSYTIKTYFPGIGYQKVKVKFEAITKEDGAYYGYAAKRAQVVMRCTLPKATQNKIKQNVVKIYKASKFKSNAIRVSNVMIDANTGYAFNNSNISGKIFLASAKNTDQTAKVFRQTADGWKVNYTCTTGVTSTYEIIYPSQNEGNILVGFAGTTKEVANYNNKYTSFTRGNAPITKTTFFKKKMKSLSVFTRI